MLVNETSQQPLKVMSDQCDQTEAWEGIPAALLSIGTFFAWLLALLVALLIMIQVFRFLDWNGEASSTGWPYLEIECLRRSDQIDMLQKKCVFPFGFSV